MSNWTVDRSTIIQYDMDTESHPTASLFDSSVSFLVGSGTNYPGVNIVPGYGQGSARQFLAGSGSYYTSKTYTFNPGLIGVATLDALILKTGTIEAQIPVVGMTRNASSDTPFNIFVDTSGNLGCTAVVAQGPSPASSTTITVTSSAIFPTASWYAARATYDSSLGILSLWGTPAYRPFYDLLIQATGTAGYTITQAQTPDVLSVHVAGSPSPIGSVDGIDSVRLSMGYRVDSVGNYMMPHTGSRLTVNPNSGIFGKKHFPLRVISSAAVVDQVTTVTSSTSVVGVGPSVMSIDDEYSSGSVNWSAAIIDSTTTRDISNYSIKTLTGGTVTASLIGSIVSTAEIIEFSGDYRTGGTYQLLIKPGVARDAISGAGSTAITASFSLTGITFTGSLTTVSPTAVNKLDVTFVKPVTQVNSGNTGDALNPANYTIILSGTMTQLAILSSDHVADDEVELTLATNMSPSSLYILSIYNVTDLLGNKI